MNALRRIGLRNGNVHFPYSNMRLVISARSFTSHTRRLVGSQSNKLKTSSPKPPPAPIRPSRKDQTDRQENNSQEEQHEEQDKQESQSDGPKHQQWRATYREILSTLGLTASLMLVGHFFVTHFYSFSYPLGASMLPTFYFSGDGVIISKLYRHGKGIRVGDVVCALHPLFPEGNAVLKRVVGMPGDFVWVPYAHGHDIEGEINQGMIPYWHDTHKGDDAGRIVQVPRGHCWLAGDNHTFSRDSRYYGPVPLGLVIGKVVWRVLPIGRFGAVENIMEEVDEADMLL